MFITIIMRVTMAMMIQIKTSLVRRREVMDDVQMRRGVRKLRRVSSDDADLVGGLISGGRLVRHCKSLGEVGGA
jgi:hypothetical protein